MSDFSNNTGGGGSGPGLSAGHRKRYTRGDPPEWLIPLAMLVVMSVASSWIVFILSGGSEIADDAGHLTALVKDPLALLGDYSERGFSENWGSLPPLLPILFGILVAPWLLALPDFWGLRIGVLTWSAAALIILSLVLDGVEPVRPGRKKLFLAVFALAPSVWGAVGLIPQEEIYVSLFVMGLYALARKGYWRHLWAGFVLGILAGKYFLLVLAIPIAFLSPRPLRYFASWILPAGALLCLHVIYHRVFFGLTPVLGHSVDPSGSISIWALAWSLGLRLPPQVINGASVVLAATLSSLFAWKCRREIPGSFLMAGVLYITLLTVSITFPAYMLWVLPLTLLCAARMSGGTERAAAAVLIFVWGGAEWGENLFRGVSLALSSERGAGKTRLAEFVQKILGEGFPYSLFHILCVIIAILCGVSMIFLLLKSGRRVMSDLSVNGEKPGTGLPGVF